MLFMLFSGGTADELYSSSPLYSMSEMLESIIFRFNSLFVNFYYDIEKVYIILESHFKIKINESCLEGVDSFFSCLRHKIKELSVEDHDNLLHILEEEDRTALGRARLDPRIKARLLALKSRGLDVYVTSALGEDPVRDRLLRDNILRIISAVYGRGKGFDERERLENLLRDRQLDIGKTLYIGNVEIGERFGLLSLAPSEFIKEDLFENEVA